MATICNKKAWGTNLRIYLAKIVYQKIQAALAH